MSAGRTWRKGPPPHVGWWNATSDPKDAPETFSWWNGRRWSLGSQPDADAEMAARRAKFPRDIGDAPNVRWTHYYPLNARVPRVDPRKAKGGAV